MADLSILRKSFSGHLLTEYREVAPFVTDWRGKWTGKALCVVQPDSTEDVAHVVRWCHQNKVPVVPQGGNTGLSGGATPDASGKSLVLSLSRLRRVRCIDIVNSTITVDAGVTLQEVQEKAREVGRLFPLSLAAQGTCTLGGNLATNAGGVQVLRYGNARELCLGLEVVTAQGEVWNGLRGLRKDNTGYDLRDLYIGSEGTLGIITGATMKLFPLPASQIVAFAAIPNPQAAVDLLQLSQAHFGSGLTGFELMNDTCMQLVQKHMPGNRLPLNDRSPWYALIEMSSANRQDATQECFQYLLECGMERGWITDAAVSNSLAQAKAFWALRENISEAQGAEGKTIKHDISLPIHAIPHFLSSTSEELARKFSFVRMVIFGHMGDGNLHYNASPPEIMAATSSAVFVESEARMNKVVHDAVDAHGGSISAEHGLGVLRRDEAMRYRSSIETQLMQTIKTALDPMNLMNPDKVLPC